MPTGNINVVQPSDIIVVTRKGKGFFATISAVGSAIGGGPHAATHENGGSDEISVLGLSGLLADDQNPTAHAVDHENGGSDEISVLGLSGLLADDQNPTAHATDHENGGLDEINVVGLSGVLADGQPVTIQDEGVNVTATPHTILDFVGVGVAVTNSGGGVATITIAGGAGQNVFETVAGDSGSAVADSPTDTISLVGAISGGITTTALTTPDQILFDLTPIDLATGAAVLALGDFLIVSDSADIATTVALKYTFQDLVDDLDIPNAITVNGLVVRTAADAYASRTILAEGAGVFDGIVITFGDGVGGNPQIGLDITGLPADTTVIGGDQFPFFDAIGVANERITATNLAASLLVLDGPNLFESIAADSGADSVADTRTDTLTIAGGIGVTTLSVPASDQITITANPSRIVSFVIETPTTADDAILQHKFGEAVTITRVSASCNAGATCTIQFDERAEATPNTGGTDVLTAALVADDTTEATTSFANAGIAADAILNLDIDAITSAPTVVRIHVEFELA